MPELMCALVPIHKCSITRVHITIIHWCVANKIRKYLIGHTIPCSQKSWRRIKVGSWFSIARVKYNLGLHWTIVYLQLPSTFKKDKSLSLLPNILTAFPAVQYMSCLSHMIPTSSSYYIYAVLWVLHNCNV